MFREFLARHPLSSLLTSSGPFVLYPPKGSEAWRRIPGEALEEIARESDKTASVPYPMRTASGFLAFVRTGSRRADEENYFLRRRKLCWAALRCCTDADASPDEVIDGLWCIAEETSWVVSAHNVNPIPGAPSFAEYPLPDPDRPYIDLFSAQTGMILSIVTALLGEDLDRVSPLIRSRVRREIERRILRPFMENDDFWWMGFRRRDLCNWTPWIVSNILVTACLADLPGDVSLPALIERALAMLDRWLDVVPADGGCDEGAGYWNMAGGALLDCIETLEKACGGLPDLWRDEKLRAIASFPMKAEIGRGWFVNFADCDARPVISGERLQYAGERLDDPALVSFGHRFRGTAADRMNDVPHLTRLLSYLFRPDREGTPSPPPGDVWLEDLQLRLVRRGRLTLCVKGGHNGESHNHNDVGSFMLFRDGEPEIVDAGNMTYTARTFSSERYTLWNVRSAWHNLPLPGGREQKPGARYGAASVRCLPDGLSLDLTGAYGSGDVLSAEREVRLTPEGAEVRDRIVLAGKESTVWVFMLRSEPKLCPGSVLSGGIRLLYPEGFTAAAEEIPIDDPRMARNFPGSLYRVFIASPAEESVGALFRILAEE